MLDVGAPELLIVLVIVLVVFGGGKLPQVAGSLGKSIRDFRAATQSQTTNSVENTTVEPVKTVSTNQEA